MCRPLVHDEVQMSGLWLLALSCCTCYFGGKCPADVLVLLLKAGDQLRCPCHRPILTQSLQFSTQRRHRACSQVVAAALEVVSRSPKLLRLPFGHGLAQSLQEWRCFELECLGQFLHDIQLPFPLELTEFS